MSVLLDQERAPAWIATAMNWLSDVSEERGAAERSGGVAIWDGVGQRLTDLGV